LNCRENCLAGRIRRDSYEIATAIEGSPASRPAPSLLPPSADGWIMRPGIINWRLIFALRRVPEHMTAYQLAYLRHLSHGAEFWQFVRTLTPGWVSAKAWLDRHQLALAADFFIIV
jgi:hypothetical protein